MGHAALARLVRDEGPRVLATLVRTTGSLRLAEDAVQYAVLRALDTWPRDGIPPGAARVAYGYGPAPRD